MPEEGGEMVYSIQMRHMGDQQMNECLFGSCQTAVAAQSKMQRLFPYLL